MIVDVSERVCRCTQLLQQAQYWKAQHARAVQREAGWKQRALDLERLVRQQEALIGQLTARVETLTAEVRRLRQQVFGRKAEPIQSPTVEQAQADDSSCGLPEAAQSRGQKAGGPGHARKTHDDLPTEEIFHDLEEQERCCPRCRKPFVGFPGTEDSEEIDWQVKVVRRLHRRKRYRPTCDCQAVSGIVTAPCPDKLIPKGLFSVGFWVRVLLEKFLFQRPLYRVLQVLRLEGLEVSEGTLTGGLQRIAELLQPMYAQILQRNRSSQHWHWDETRWMVFEPTEDKHSYRWWLWVSVTPETCVYLLDPSRSTEVPRKHLGQEAQGIISADRYAVYQKLGEKIRVAFCWAHVRRDFLELGRGYPKLKPWAQAWVRGIDELFCLNRKRIQAASGSETFGRQDQVLRGALTAMANLREQELGNLTLHPVQRKVLESLRRHWEGLTLFVEHPKIPMDNNEAERRLRNPVIGRKNYYGSGSVWSGTLTAMLFTLFQTLLINHVDPKLWFEAYFEACAGNRGNPPNELQMFLPWNLSEEHKADWRYPKPSPSP
jgi:transposase